MRAQTVILLRSKLSMLAPASHMNLLHMLLKIDLVSEPFLALVTMYCMNSPHMLLKIAPIDETFHTLITLSFSLFFIGL